MLTLRKPSIASLPLRTTGRGGQLCHDARYEHSIKDTLAAHSRLRLRRRVVSSITQRRVLFIRRAATPINTSERASKVSLFDTAECGMCHGRESLLRTFVFLEVVIVAVKIGRCPIVWWKVEHSIAAFIRRCLLGRIGASWRPRIRSCSHPGG